MNHTAHIAALILILVFIAGCATRPPQWSAMSESAEVEYGPYLKSGTGSLSGQAFLTQQGGGVVTAAGRTITLDPATSIGDEWWSKAGGFWVHRALTPPSPGFNKARRITTADADGKFRFQEIPAGRYYIRTEVTWIAGGDNQGGLIGQVVEVKENENKEVIVHEFKH